MMNISGIAGAASSQQQQSIKRANEKLQAAIASLVSGTRLNKASDNVAALSIATQLQSEVSSLKQVSGNLAQAASLTQVADGGAEKIQEVVQELRSVAQRAASPTLDDGARKALNDQAQQLSKEIDRLSGNTTFNNKKLLDGSVKEEDALSLGQLIDPAADSDEGSKLEIDDLSQKALFEGKKLDLTTADGAKNATEILDAALSKITRARADIGSFQQTLNYAAANIDSAVINQEAARAVLQDTDFAEESTNFTLGNLQRNAGLAVLAQGNRLSPNLVKLIS